jgi:hypothetical protein
MALTDQQQTTRSIAAEWFGILAGPLAWLLQFIINYALVRRACITHSTMSLHVVSALFLIVAVTAGIASAKKLLHFRADSSSAEAMVARSHFMAIVGVFSSTLYTLAIIMQVIASFIWNPCIR